MNVKNCLRVVYELKYLCLGLKNYIRDIKIAESINQPYPSKIKIKNGKVFLTENKYKSLQITLIESNRYPSKIRIQECRRQGKIIDGVMIPEPIKNAYIDIDIKLIYPLIHVFRLAGKYFWK